MDPNRPDVPVAYGNTTGFIAIVFVIENLVQECLIDIASGMSSFRFIIIKRNFYYNNKHMKKKNEQTKPRDIIWRKET
jgi:hypothetical protein